MTKNKRTPAGSQQRLPLGRFSLFAGDRPWRRAVPLTEAVLHSRRVGVHVGCLLVAFGNLLYVILAAAIPFFEKNGDMQRGQIIAEKNDKVD
jgi:hypothetical protein